MIIFALPPYAKLARELVRKKRARRGVFSAERFADGELWLALKTAVVRQECLIIGSFSPPDENILSTLLLADTLKRHGAKKVTLLLPFMAYARQDKDKRGVSRAAAWLTKIIPASGIDNVLALDVHSERVPKMLPNKFVNISALPLFAQTLKKAGLKNATIIAPDEGVLKRARELAVLLGQAPSQVAYFLKKRTAHGVIHSNIHGRVGEHAVIIDDMLDTGGTLVSACAKLRQVGVKKITIVVTHGLFTGTKWQRLWRLGVDKIYCTDSLPTKPNSSKKIHRMLITSLIGDIL